MLKPKVTLPREVPSAAKRSAESSDKRQTAHVHRPVPSHGTVIASERDSRALVSQIPMRGTDPVILLPKALAKAVLEPSDVDALAVILMNPREALDALREMGMQQANSESLGTPSDVPQTLHTHAKYHDQARQTMDEKRTESAMHYLVVQNMKTIESASRDMEASPSAAIMSLQQFAQSSKVKQKEMLGLGDTRDLNHMSYFGDDHGRNAVTNEPVIHALGSTLPSAQHGLEVKSRASQTPFSQIEAVLLTQRLAATAKLSPSQSRIAEVAVLVLYLVILVILIPLTIWAMSYVP